MKRVKLFSVLIPTVVILSVVWLMLFARLYEDAGIRIHSASKDTKELFNSMKLYIKDETTTQTRQSTAMARNQSLAGNCTVVSKLDIATQLAEYPYFQTSFTIENSALKVLTSAGQFWCNKNIQIFDRRFGLLHDVIMDNTKLLDRAGKPKGGEPLNQVLGQREKDEFFSYRKGFWSMHCNSNDSSSVSQNAFPWLPYLDVKSGVSNVTSGGLTQSNTEKRFTIAITREDYCNLHNFVRQMFNAFLLMMIYKKEPKEMAILFLDAHPTCILDSSWRLIFGHVYWASRLSGPVLYKNIIWGFKEGDSQLTQFDLKNISYIEEFRSYFLQEYNLNANSTLECRRVVITIILRHNQVFHPRNQKGIVGRKIYNEDEIINALVQTFPNACVQAVRMESLTMRGQLETISTTDLLIGMHGAGMTHTIFLPRHAAVLEMLPKGFKIGRHWYLCYQRITEWRGLKYQSWENFEDSLEKPGEYTVIPKDIILAKVKDLMNQLCSAG